MTAIVLWAHWGRSRGGLPPGFAFLGPQRDRISFSQETGLQDKQDDGLPFGSALRLGGTTGVQATGVIDGRNSSEYVVTSKQRGIAGLPLVARGHYICDVQ